MSKPEIKRIDDAEPTLKEMQEYVGGYIEVVYINDESEMVIDEEGKLKGKSVNKEATTIAHEHQAIFNDDYIAGDVMLLSGKARLS